MPRRPSVPIDVFVYGTLKRGYANHRRFCAAAVAIEPATVWGRLYHLPEGFPALEVPPHFILAPGSTNPRCDALTQARLSAGPAPRPLGDWDPVQGEILRFTDAPRALPPMDRLEGFTSRGNSIYRRVVVPAWTATTGETVPVWAYCMSTGAPRAAGGKRLRGGRWGRTVL